jgi:hypothetical protein
MFPIIGKELLTLPTPCATLDCVLFGVTTEQATQNLMNCTFHKVLQLAEQM